MLVAEAPEGWREATQCNVENSGGIRRILPARRPWCES